MLFVKGGVVSGLIMFFMCGVIGLMGEVGFEVIMLFMRGVDGSFGVKVSGGCLVNIMMNILMLDVDGFC